LKILPNFLPIIRSDIVVITGMLSKLSPINQDDGYLCKINQINTIEWKIQNLTKEKLDLVFRMCPVQETNTGIICHNSTGMIALGTTSRVLPVLEPESTLAFSTKVYFQMPGMVKIMAHVQRFQSGNVPIENLNEIHWQKSSISILVEE
jgi:hypothetical protein